MAGAAGNVKSLHIARIAHDGIVRDDEAGLHDVTFRIGRRLVTVGRGTLLDYDGEALWVSREDARARGLPWKG